MNFSQYIDLRGKSIRIDGLKEGGGFKGATARTMYGLLALKGVLIIVLVFVSIREIVANRILLPRGAIFLGSDRRVVRVNLRLFKQQGKIFVKTHINTLIFRVGLFSLGKNHDRG